MSKITFMGAGSTVFARNVIWRLHVLRIALRDSDFRPLRHRRRPAATRAMMILEAMRKTKGGYGKHRVLPGRGAAQGGAAGRGFCRQRHSGGAVRSLHHHRL